MSGKIVGHLFYCACLFMVTVLGTVRSAPIYGKIDFLLLDGRPWWPAWEALIQETRAKGHGGPVYTDYITGYILAGIFGEKTVVNVGDDKIPTLFVDDMVEDKVPEAEFLSQFLLRTPKADNFKCVVNLIGYRSSWVPIETHHWNKTLADTRRFYQFRDTEKNLDFHGELERTKLKRCTVYSSYDSHRMTVSSKIDR